MAKKTLYLMRHGETLFNTQEKMQGWCDSPLTEKGKAQARKAREEFFADKEIDFAYCSSLERAVDTLELVTDLPYQRIKGLKELNFGRQEGQPINLQPKDKRTFYKEFGGETIEEALERIYAALVEIMEKEDHDRVLCVSHGGILKAFYGRWKSPDSENLAGKVGNCTIFTYQYDTETKEFACINVHLLGE